MSVPFLLAADAWTWIKLAFLLLPVLALLWRALVGDQDDQARAERRRADQMDRMLDPDRQRAELAASRVERRAPLEAEVVETRPSSLRSERVEEHLREFVQRVSHDVSAQGPATKIQDEVEKKFERRHVGHLSSADESPSEGAQSPTLSIQAAAIELNAERMRQAFLLREILRRPEFE